MTDLKTFVIVERFGDLITPGVGDQWFLKNRTENGPNSEASNDRNPQQSRRKL